MSLMNAVHNPTRFQIIAQRACVNLGNDFYEADVIRNMDRHILEVTRYLATGDQVKAQSTVRTEVTSLWGVPASPWDWIKQAITEWQPSLNFGWLAPQMCTLERTVEMTEHAKYYNVFPLPKQMAKQGDLELRHVRLPEITPVQWLTSEPFTREDFQTANRVMEQKLSARELAEFLAFYHVNRGLN